MINKNLLNLFNVCKRYDKNIIFKNVNMKIKLGEHISIIGASGSGKSTFLNLLSGLENASSGKVLYQCVNWAKMKEKHKNNIRKKNLGFIYQYHYLMPELTVLENIAMPLIINEINPKTACCIAYRLLKKINLSSIYNMKPFQLSVGIKHRVSFARAIVNKPAFILADEPTKSLDIKNSLIAIKYLKYVSLKYGSTLIIVTHNRLIANLMKKRYIIKNGRINALP